MGQDIISNISVKNVEYIVLTIIIIFQLIVFSRNFIRIRKFRRIFSKNTIYRLRSYLIPVSGINNIEYILDNLNEYIEPLELEETETVNDQMNVKVALISLEDSIQSNALIDEMIRSINSYLIKNRGAVADFHLIKDIVQRYTDSIEDEINISLPLPIYLGLIGTMAGIIIGLLFMPSVGIDLEEFLKGKGIDVLIGGVKIAMWASLAGLSMTTINSGIFYKGAKNEVESGKNRFFSFIQAELLPILSQNINTAIWDLNRSFGEFNRDFFNNLQSLKDIVDKNYESINIQLEVLEELKKINPQRLTKDNLILLNRLEKSSSKIEQFNQYLDQLNSFVENSIALNNNLLDILKRTDNVEEIANSIKETTSENSKLMQFLTAHISQVEKHGTLMESAVVEVNKVLESSLKALEDFVKEKISSIQTITIDEQEIIRNAKDDIASSFKDLLTHVDNTREAAIKQSEEDFKKLLESTSEHFEVIRALVLENSNFNKLNEVIQKLDDGTVNLVKLAEKDSFNRLVSALVSLESNIKEIKRIEIEIIGGAGQIISGSQRHSWGVKY